MGCATSAEADASAIQRAYEAREEAHSAPPHVPSRPATDAGGSEDAASSVVSATEALPCAAVPEQQSLPTFGSPLVPCGPTASLCHKVAVLASLHPPTPMIDHSSRQSYHAAPSLDRMPHTTPNQKPSPPQIGKSPMLLGRSARSNSLVGLPAFPCQPVDNTCNRRGTDVDDDRACLALQLELDRDYVFPAVGVAVPEPTADEMAERVAAAAAEAVSAGRVNRDPDEFALPRVHPFDLQRAVDLATPWIDDVLAAAEDAAKYADECADDTTLLHVPTEQTVSDALPATGSVMTLTHDWSFTMADSHAPGSGPLGGSLPVMGIGRRRTSVTRHRGE
eukprot:CAMPEP_0174828848 /NCGR_PEP_ID=MMETSP1114-20130205/1569_1 /TAXON_ID=312471 /ORGANISM="Neobodo designis, Strain CCAP 1951/1" /LENGTH=334 /DNA_ID=CAMNT_0016062575 /DNA_START=326 /DNA_END=1330 /DNA_ORIENTATION=+